MAPRDFFVRLVRMYKCPEFHCSRTVCRAGLMFLLSMLVQIWFLKLFGLWRLNGKSKQKVFDNFSSSRSWDDTEWSWSHCDKIPQTSLFKYVWCKRGWNKNFIFIAPPRPSAVAKVHKFWCTDSQCQLEQMCKVSCQSVQRLMRYKFWTIIAPSSGESPPLFVMSFPMICGTHMSKLVQVGCILGKIWKISCLAS